MPFHPFTKEALKNINYSESFGKLEEIIEAEVFNSVRNHGVKIIDKMYSSSKGSATKLKNIAAMLKVK